MYFMGFLEKHKNAMPFPLSSMEIDDSVLGM